MPILLALRALHYSCALAATVYTLISTAISLGRVKRFQSKTFRPSIFITTLLVVSYLVDGGFEIRNNDFTTCQPYLLHMILLASVWSVTGLRQRPWYDVLVLSLITIAFETPIVALSVELELLAQLASQVVRLVLFVFLVLASLWTFCKEKPESESEEASPLLRGQDTTYGTEPIDDSDDSDDDDKEIKEARAKRLQETGSWFAYLQDFQIFLPFLIPRNDRKVQLCIAINLLCVAGERVMNILIPRQLGIVTNQILGKEAPIQALGIWLAMELGGNSTVSMIRGLVTIPIKQFSYRGITNAAFNHVMNLSMDFHSQRDSAEVMKAVEQGESLTTLLEESITDLIPTIIDLVVACGILYWKFNIYTSLAMGVACITYMTVEVLTSNWNVANRRTLTKSQRDQTRIMHQTIQGWQTVSYFNRFFFERRRFGGSVDSQLKASARWERRDEYGRGILNVLVQVTFFVLACLVLYEITHGRASAGDFVFFLQYWDILIYPLMNLSDQYRWLTSLLVDAERLLLLLKTEPSITDEDGAKDLPYVEGHVSFKNVNFSYDPRKPTVDGINITASPGQTIALVGMTGAGKSSILKLLLRFYDVTSGTISIDTHDIRTVTLSSLREAIGVVPQDPLLFNTSIIENLRYARPSASDTEIFSACASACIHDRILTFPDGYSTVVGEQGVKLSGGELQRLAIARVFLKNSPILLLDEATSAVDTNTESEIQAALDRVRNQRTTFVIAHRLSTVVSADKILVMHEGRIVERGTHGELLGIGGRYSGLWARQSGGVLVQEVDDEM